MRKWTPFISLRFAATAALLAATLLLTSLAARRYPDSLAVPLEQIPDRLAGWHAVKDATLDAAVLGELKPTSYLSRTYRKGSRQLDLFVAFYSQQRAGESMHSPKHCLPGSGWEIWQYGSAAVPAGAGTVDINRYSINNMSTRMLMYYWYQSKNEVIANEYVGKLLLARDTLLTGRTGGTIVRVTLSDVAGASAEAEAFASEVIREVQRCFGKQAA